MSAIIVMYIYWWGGSFIDSAQLRFPTYFPENCPPAEALAEECVLFRLCKGPVLSEKDFVPFYLINPEKHKNNVNAYGLSVFKSFDDCKRALSKAPKLRKKYKRIANGTNNKYRGRIMHTPSGDNPNHYTWWLYDGVMPHTFFEICNEGGEINE